MPRLIQLESGDWLDPALVKVIRAFDNRMPRVVVDHETHSFVIKFPTFAAACEARDKLAALVNEVSVPATEESVRANLVSAAIDL